MRALSLYSGVGGVDLAAHWAGIETVAFCEADEFCRSVLARHWPAVPCFDSDEKVTKERLGELGITDCDLVFGGPPCQPFSVAGKREGTADPRHRWPEMLRIVSEIRPTWVVIENVSGFGPVADALVCPDLEGEGYEVWPVAIPACGVGAPHKRERVFIVAHTNGGRREGERIGGILNGKRETLGNNAHGSGGAGRVGLADTNHSGRQEQRGAESVPTEQRSSERGSREAVEHSAEPGRQGSAKRWVQPGEPPARREESSTLEYPTARGIRRWQTQGEGRLASLADEGSWIGTTESRLGRVLDGIAARLDSARWPAARGCEQFPYEPPRTTLVRKHRRKRLEALGNAVVPYQVYPILKLIAEIEREGRE